MNLTYFDTEMTGNTEDDVIIRLGLLNEVNSIVLHEINAYFSNGDIPISLTSMAEHDLTEETVRSFPIFSSSVIEYKILESELCRRSIFVGHGVDEDMEMFDRYGIHIKNHIDTQRVMKHLFIGREDELENCFRLDVVRYYLLKNGVTISSRGNEGLCDVFCIKALFKFLLRHVKDHYELENDEEAIQKMIDLTDTPVLIRSLPFGKKELSALALELNPRNMQWVAGEA